MKKIELSGKNGIGKFALVDDEDYEFLSQYKWHYAKGYAKRWQYFKGDKIEKRLCKLISMHRIIINAPKDLEVDHINMNRLDNRKSNLRLCNKSQNQANTPIDKTNRSGYKGVCIERKRNKVRWRADIVSDSKRTFIGYFPTAKDAAMAYNKKAKELFGEFAYLNKI